MVDVEYYAHLLYYQEVQDREEEQLQTLVRTVVVE